LQGLRPFALSVFTNTDFNDTEMAPVGQHGVSIYDIDSENPEILSLFNNGMPSVNGNKNNSAPGHNNVYSYPMRYRINVQNKTAELIWYYDSSSPYDSNIVSSIYSYQNFSIINYGNIVNGYNSPLIRIINSQNNDIIDVEYQGGFSLGWNAEPVLPHLYFDFPAVRQPNKW
jgi:hypothetical protein